MCVGADEACLVLFDVDIHTSKDRSVRFLDGRIRNLADDFFELGTGQGNFFICLFA